MSNYDAFNQRKHYSKNYKNRFYNKNIPKVITPKIYEDAKEIIRKYEWDKPLEDIGGKYTPAPPSPSLYARSSPKGRDRSETHESFVSTPGDDLYQARYSPELLNGNESLLREKIMLEKPIIDVDLFDIKSGTSFLKTTFKPLASPAYRLEEIIIDDEIKNIQDLIKLANKYETYNPMKKYSINLQKLHKITPYLKELDEMIGMNDVKTRLITQLLYFLQGFPCTHMLHTVIEGPPGVGKSCLGKILSKIYIDLECIKTDVKPELIEEEGPMNMIKIFSSLKTSEDAPKSKFKIVKRSDLIGQHVGHTAIKTQKIINECYGGVLFIDEAYSLANDDGFSKECINTLNQNLSENGDKFICIIAGYSAALEGFFAMNSGLSRRFPFRYNINKYSGKELYEILIKKINQENYIISSDFSLDKFIEENKDNFPNYGGDIETLFFHIKMEHSKRVFGKAVTLRNIFTKDDIVNGYNQLNKNKIKQDVSHHYMYN
jgi:SpoVK/Ycf46/Vps4 family AAA+-type ATPase